MFYSCVCLGNPAQENGFLSPSSCCTWKCHHLFGYVGGFGAIIEGPDDALWCEVHAALIILCCCFFLFKQTREASGSCHLCVFCLYVTYLYASYPTLSSFRWYAGPVEVASPPWEDQRQLIKAEGDRWLRDCQSRPADTLSPMIWPCFFLPC